MDQPTQELHICSWPDLHASARAPLTATCEPLVAADHHCPLHAKAQAGRMIRSGSKRKWARTDLMRHAVRAGDDWRARIWAIARATGYSARPRSGRPLFGEAIARERGCGPWRRSQCRRGGVRRMLPRDRERAASSALTHPCVAKRKPAPPLADTPRC
jgi:hypothetical protein